MEPIFAPPGTVIPISGQDALIAFLEHYDVPLSRWENRDEILSKLWEEIKNHDTVYILRLVGSSWRPVRYLLTVAARVRVERHLSDGSREHLVLTEYVRGDTHWHPRRFSDTSLSEKVLLNAYGSPVETGAQTIRRCLVQEVSLYVGLRTVKRGLQCWPWNEAQPTEEPIRILGSQNVECHVHEKETMPGLLHCNQIARYNVTLPSSYHFFGLRVDRKTKYRSRWSSVHEPAVLDPIPVELVLG